MIFAIVVIVVSLVACVALCVGALLYDRRAR